ncbi:glycerophosphoryl diester phosphodiesterase membrane domain-containing protein [Streptomyces liangshanensis]|uniref:glycerophosphoryl diester phosphodiesterase membrane domain-containing protein n=1 Tax=Streptomyces liangshanensis TaxID=2717324 RepID=UPI0036DE635A
MNDTPGWASPGSAPSDGQDASVPRPAEPADDTGTPTKWSKTQPPPGQWSPPSAQTPGQPGPTPPHPAPAWGAGWGGPGQGGAPGPAWGRPPAAKPGVIPLRPLGVGEILDGAVSTLRAHWRTVLGVTLAVAVVTQICDILVVRYLVPEPGQIDPEATPSEALSQAGDSIRDSLFSLAPTTVITLLGTLFTTAVLTMVVSRSILGRPVTLTEAWQEARPRLPQLLGLTLLLPLAAVVIMGVGVAPGILVGSTAGVLLAVLGGLIALVVISWLMVRYALASPALMLERQGIGASLRRSAKLVRGSWWRIFGIQSLTLLLTFLITMIVSIPFAIVALATDGSGIDGLVAGSTPEYGWTYLIITGIGAVIASSISYPISAGVTVLLYVDQRIRREALDLELARAAGLTGNGTPGTATPGS